MPRCFQPLWSVDELTESFVIYSPNDGPKDGCKVAVHLAVGGLGELLTWWLRGLR
jgi:hypothetical protein